MQQGKVLLHACRPGKSVEKCSSDPEFAIFQMILNYIGCKIAEETKQSSNSINRYEEHFAISK
jgi:hypothetical protein